MTSNRYTIEYRLAIPVTITLNGDTFEVAGPLTVSDLLVQLDIDARRVAVEHNLTVLKRAAFDTTAVREGDVIEVVNFVGGGGAAFSPADRQRGRR
jgi:thiamine biosynthesis protein ThiS